MSKKPIIVFEGIEGSGKSHHISAVAKYLRKKKDKLFKNKRAWWKFKFRKNSKIDFK